MKIVSLLLFFITSVQLLAVEDMKWTAIFGQNKAKKLISLTSYETPKGITGYWTPRVQDLKGVEEKLNSYLKEQGVEKAKDFSTYIRQVTGVKKGEDKYLYLYYSEDVFRSLTDTKKPSIEHWRLHPRTICDGGDGVFRVLYFLKDKKFIWFECNGGA